jgi:Cu+-exporting ATPase
VLDVSHVLAGDGSTVTRLREQGRTVAVVGGPADATALAAADVALVRDRPAGPAGIALRDDDPLTAVDALRLARRAVRTVERLAVGTVVYHLAVLPLAVTGLLPPVATAAAGVVWGVGCLACAVGVRRVRPLARPAS